MNGVVYWIKKKCLRWKEIDYVLRIYNIKIYDMERNSVSVDCEFEGW